MATDQRGAAAFRVEPMASSFGRVLLGSGPGETPATRLPPGTLLRDVLAESGAVLLRDFGLTVSDFDDFTLDPGDRFLVHPGTVNGGRESVTATTATVDSGVLPFPWHRELGYAPSPPDLVLFYGERPAGAGAGGETWLTDGCAIADRLSEPTRRFVESRRITHTYQRREDAFPVAFGGAQTRDQVDTALTEVAFRVAPAEQLEWEWIRDGVRLRFTTSMLTSARWQQRPAFCNQVIFQVRRGGWVTMDDGSTIPDDVVAEAEGLADDLAYPIQWQPGDLVVCDNSRVMHARRQVTDTERRILARVCYTMA
jgi:alpha-ketoglutarate-dependent taurine dioxygenase